MKMIPFGNDKEMRYLMNKQEQLFDTVNIMHFKDILEKNYNITVSYLFLYNFLKKHNIKILEKIKKSKTKKKPTRAFLSFCFF